MTDLEKNYGQEVAESFRKNLATKTNPLAKDYLECLHEALKEDAGTFSPKVGRTCPCCHINGTFLPD